MIMVSIGEKYIEYFDSVVNAFSKAENSHSVTSESKIFIAYSKFEEKVD